jgi:hypothetical protein
MKTLEAFFDAVFSMGFDPRRQRAGSIEPSPIRTPAGTSLPGLMKKLTRKNSADNSSQENSDLRKSPTAQRLHRQLFQG